MCDNDREAREIQSKRKSRSILSKAQVLEIYELKDVPNKESPIVIAAEYGVSEKAIRDIWKARTWAKDTWHLDTSRPTRIRPLYRRKKLFIRRQADNSECLNPSTCEEGTEKFELDLPECLPISNCKNQQESWAHPGHNFFMPPVYHDGSVDSQLNRWADGEETLSAVLDPFLKDWTKDVDASDLSCKFRCVCRELELGHSPSVL